jgi:ATP-binding cassette subfamily B protein
MLSVSERVGVLRGVGWLAGLSEQQLEILAVALRERDEEPGTELVRLGDPADQLFVLVRGRAEVTIPGPRAPVALALVGQGDVFGELALLAPDGRRTATVTTLEPTVVLALDASVFTRLLDDDPAARATFEAHGEQLLTARFIQLVAPFGGLDDDGRRWLADRVKRRSFDAGAVIVRQGEPGESCFIVRSGEADVLVAGEFGE